MIQLSETEAKDGAACVRSLCGVIRAVLAKRPDLTPAERAPLESAWRVANRLHPAPQATKRTE